MENRLRIAHRGFSEHFPENTLAAFKAARESGAHMIEFDIQLAADGIPVVIHDDTLDRTAGRSGSIGDFESRELSAMDVSMGMTGSREGIPLLSQVLEEFRGSMEFNIELKNLPVSYPGIVKAVISEIDRQNCRDSCIVSSFDHHLLAEMKERSKARRGMLYDCRPLLFFEEIDLVAPYSLHPGIDSMHQGDLEKAVARGLRVYPWVARTRQQFQRLMKNPVVHGIMVNDLTLFSSYQELPA